MEKIEQIKNNSVYKQMMADSFGGIMYNVENYGKYDTTKILEIWESMNASEKEAADGIVKGAMNFAQGK